MQLEEHSSIMIEIASTILIMGKSTAMRGKRGHSETEEVQQETYYRPHPAVYKILMLGFHAL